LKRGVQNPTHIQRGGKSGCSMVIMMGLVACCHGSVFLVVYKGRLNLLGMKIKVMDVKDE